MHLEKKREYVKFVRFFITQKFPAINSIYLDEAEKKLFEWSVFSLCVRQIVGKRSYIIDRMII